jgi:hypothetical protein
MGVNVSVVSNGKIKIGKDDDGNVQYARCDENGNLYVVPVLPQAPTTSTPVVITGDDPLEVGPNPIFIDEDYTIPDGKTFYLQFVLVGTVGDPSEKGSKVEVFYIDNSSVLHIISRIYVVGQTQPPIIYPDITTTRDGTTMVGASGGNTKIRVRRTRMSVSAQEIDAEIRGYTLNT